jgi:DNA (cytosine-5)-methyltransferase 1
MEHAGKYADHDLQGSLFSEAAHGPESTTPREVDHRSAVDLFVDHGVEPNLPPLIMPRRWEALEVEARKRAVPLKPIIMPVQPAIAEVEKELRQIRESGMGRLMVMSGVTGSGKTTFLNSLSFFIDDIGVHTVRGLTNVNSREDVETALAALRRENDRLSVIVLEGKEAPGSFRNDEIDVLLTTLNADFRKESGRRTLFVIPTTSQSVAQNISSRAANVGGMTSKSRPFYVFPGPAKNDYISITDDMLRALNESRTLLEYGMSEPQARGIAESAESLGDFIENCYNEIEQHREAVRNTAASIKRKRIHLWMVFCALEEDPRRNNDIIRSLTFGGQQHVQVARIITGDSQEVRFWEKRRGAFAQAAQYLDLRIMYLPIRTINAIATAYGPSEFVQRLKDANLIEREATRATAQDSLESTALLRFINKTEFDERDPSRRGKVDDKQRNIFKQVCEVASKNDKAVNLMIAAALRDIIKVPDHQVVTELSLNDKRKLLTDIAVVTPTDIYCLELKWRSGLLNDSEVIRQTAGRIKEYSQELTELSNLLETHV